MIKTFDNSPLFSIFFISLIARILAAFFFSDNTLVNEWSLLVNNLEVSGILGMNVVINEFEVVQKIAEEGNKVLPSIFMPPLYAFFIYVIKIFSFGILDFINVVIFLQIVINLLSIFLFYKIIEKFFNKKIVYLVTLTFSLFPLHIFATVQISSISLQLFLLIGFLYFILQCSLQSNYKNLFLFSLFSGLLILIRGEFFLFYFITLFYFFYLEKKSFKKIAVSLVITLLVVSPYLKRNYNYFNTVVLTKSFGYNLLKGNNPEFKVEGNPNFVEKYNLKSFKINADNNYEIKVDNFYKEEALNYIKKDPLRYIKYYFLKVFSFIIIDISSTYPNYFNFLHIFPKVLIGILSFIGACLSLKKDKFIRYLGIYYFTTIFLFSIFFILPRYSLILLPFQLILTMEFIRYFLPQKLFKK